MSWVPLVYGPGRISFLWSHWLVSEPLARLAVQCRYMLTPQVSLVREGMGQLSQPHYWESSLVWWVSCVIILAVKGSASWLLWQICRTAHLDNASLPCWHPLSTCRDMGRRVQLNSFLVFPRVHSSQGETEVELTDGPERTQIKACLGLVNSWLPMKLRR